MTVGRRRKGGERERGGRRRQRKGKEGECEMEVINMGTKLTHSAAAVLECAQRECSGIARGVCGGVQWGEERGHRLNSDAYPG